MAAIKVCNCECFGKDCINLNHYSGSVSLHHYNSHRERIHHQCVSMSVSFKLLDYTSFSGKHFNGNCPSGYRGHVLNGHLYTCSWFITGACQSIIIRSDDKYYCYIYERAGTGAKKRHPLTTGPNSSNHKISFYH